MRAITKKALIIGCGIAGPAAAMFLKRAGCEPVIYEAHPQHDDYAGLFLNVGRNGMRVLEELGVSEAVRAEGYEMRVMNFKSGSGKELGEIGQPHGEPQGYTVKRGFLHKALREAAERQGIPVKFGRKLASVRMTDHQVTATFENGETSSGDFLVGCDGLNSTTRSIVLPDAAKPRFTGLISFGGYTSMPAMPYRPGVQQMVFGKKAFFGYLVKPSKEVYWFGNQHYPGAPTRKELQSVPQREWKRILHELYGSDIAPVPDIVQRTTGEIGVYPIYDMPPQAKWSKGLAVLIGDAIHAISPNAGQGAALALEDAIALAQCIRDIDSIETAFAKFQQLRQSRVESIVRYSRRLGQRKHAANRVQVFFRDLLMPHFLKAANKQSHSWMYDYRVDWNEKIR